MKTRTKARSCVGKQRHPTKDEAKDHMFALIRKGAARLHVYKCKYCDKWHVGH